MYDEWERGMSITHNITSHCDRNILIYYCVAGNGFRENLEMEDYSIEKDDRDWVAEKAKWMPLSMEAKSSKRGISQALIDSYNTRVEEKQRFITQMQKILNATKVCDHSFCLFLRMKHSVHLTFAAADTEIQRKAREPKNKQRRDRNQYPYQGGIHSKLLL